MGTIENAAFTAVSQNEVGGNTVVADSISPPLNSGTSGWTIGFNQQDFSNNPSDAQATLEAALVASGVFTSTSATSIAEALTAAGTSSTVNLSGITDVDGNPATIASINAALQTTAGSNSVATSSSTDFSDDFSWLQTNVFDSPDLLTAVQNALSDPTYGPLLQTVLADYDNQYNLDLDGNMMELLTNGSATFAGGTVTLNTTSAATVSQSVMTAILDTAWVAAGNGAQACSRLANDVGAATAYDSSQGASLPSSETISSPYGTCTITPGASGTSFTGSWTDGSASGSAGGTIDVSGTNNTIDGNGLGIALSDDALATMRGTGNTATVGNDASLTLSSGSGSSTITVTGNNSTVTDYGSANSTTTSGSDDSLNLEANNQIGAVGGSGNGGYAYGTNDTIVDTGSGGGGALYGSSESVDLDGNNETGTVGGSGNGGYAYGTNDTIVDTGSGGGGALYGSSESVDLDGSSETGTVGGTGNGGYAYGTNDTIVDNGSDGGAALYGSSESLNLDGNNETGTVGGTGDGGYAYGSNDTIVDTGTGGGGALYGSDESVDLDGTSEFGTVTGTNDGAYINASSDTAYISSGANGSAATTSIVNSGETVDITATDSSGGSFSFSDNASGSGSGTYTFSGGNSLTGVADNLLSDDGSYILGTSNFSAGGSEGQFFGFNNNIIETAGLYTGGNETGELSDASVGLTVGLTVNDSFSYYDDGDLDDFQEQWYSGDTLLGYADFSASGEFESGDEEFADDGEYGDGGEFEVAATTGTGGNINNALTLNTAQFDATLPDNAIATEEAQIAAQEINFITQAPATGPTSADQTLYEGAKWNSNVITWTLANSPGTADSPFSSYISGGSQYEALIQQAFAAWGAASGLTFEEVPDSSQTDIVIGWGDFDTTSSGVVGYTTYQMQNSQLQNVIIRLEDPSQDPLITSATGTLDYSGTQAYLYQVILHEIGHALGLADNNDPSSVMYYEAGANSTTLDSNDVSGIQSLYSSSPPSAMSQEIQGALSEVSGTSVSSMLQQLVQANASFNASSLPSASSSTVTSQTDPSSLTLVTPSHTS